MVLVNPITADYKAFAAICVDVDHLATFVPWQSKMAKTEIDKIIKLLAKHGAQHIAGIGTGGSVVNAFSSARHIVRSPGGNRTTVGSDIEKMALEIAGRSNASALSSLHESWEIFIKQLYGKFVFNQRGAVPLPSRTRFHKENKKWSNYRDTQKYFHDYAAFACRTDCSEAFKAFKSHLDWKLVKVEYYPRLSLTWEQIASVVEKCRHSIVHNDGRIPNARLQKIDKALRDVIITMMRPSMLSTEPRILPSGDEMDHYIEAMVTFAYTYYVLVSMRCAWSIDVDLFKLAKKLKASS